MSRYPGKIKDPDPPSAYGAIVGNHLKHIALGTLYFESYATVLKDCVASGVHSKELIEYISKHKECFETQDPVFIYINNLGYRLEKGADVTFDIQVVDPNPLTIVAINIVPNNYTPKT